MGVEDKENEEKAAAEDKKPKKEEIVKEPVKEDKEEREEKIEEKEEVKEEKADIKPVSEAEPAKAEPAAAEEKKPELAPEKTAAEKEAEEKERIAAKHAKWKEEWKRDADHIRDMQERRNLMKGTTRAEAVGPDEKKPAAKGYKENENKPDMEKPAAKNISGPPGNVTSRNAIRDEAKPAVNQDANAALQIESPPPDKYFSFEPEAIKEAYKKFFLDKGEVDKPITESVDEKGNQQLHFSFDSPEQAKEFIKSMREPSNQKLYTEGEMKQQAAEQKEVRQPR